MIKHDIKQQNANRVHIDWSALCMVVFQYANTPRVCEINPGAFIR